MNKLTVLLLAAALVLPACGGGSTTPSNNNNNNDTMDPPPDLTDQQRTQEMLEDCEIEDLLAAAQDIVLFLQAVVNGNATAAGFTGQMAGTQIDPGFVNLPWTLDIDNDMSDDAAGTIQFFDMNDMPTNPVPDVNAWMPYAGFDMDEIENILTANPPIPDGTQMFTDYLGSSVVVATGQVAAQWSGGSATTSRGDVAVTAGGCNVQAVWSGQPLANWVGVFPSVTVTGTISEGGDTITGDIVMNGTNTATTMMTINGGETNSFQINLANGTITPVP